MLYPVAVLLLILAFPDRRDIAAAAWGVLAFGDGMATLAGRHIASPRIPWNPDKSVAGSLAFVLFGGAAGSLLCWWCRSTVIPPVYLWFSIGMPWVAALGAAAVETIPIRLDDNISVPTIASAILWTTSLISNDLAAAAAANAWRLLPLAVAVNVAVAAAGYGARTVNVPGAICGAVIGIIVLRDRAVRADGVCCSRPSALAVITSRMGLQRKTMLGIAEERGGRAALATRSPIPGSPRPPRCSARSRIAGEAARRLRRRARRRWQRHRRERNRQGLGTTDRAGCRHSPGAAGNVWSDFAGRDRGRTSSARLHSARLASALETDSLLRRCRLSSGATIGSLR